MAALLVSAALIPLVLITRQFRRREFLQASAARGSVRRGHRCPALGVQAAGGPPSAEPAG